MILPTLPDPPRHYRLIVPATAGWLTLNQRLHWGLKGRLTKHYRLLGYMVALQAMLPRIERANIVAELHFCDARRRDPHNWMPTAKAILDGIVDAGVFPDDNAKHITGPDMRLGPKVDRGKQHVVMHIWPHT